uniref:Si:ch211-202p1.5 n=1 Tax=Scleropages formosus TaxID=113540 RepID=A0A8C9RS85_SCLFO
MPPLAALLFSKLLTINCLSKKLPCCINEEPKVQPPPAPRRRMKRCSCENLKDIECVYFCHIGIVWVNTPGQVVPYGVGSLPVRLRRSSGRCVCTGDADDDTECLYFCSAEHRSTGWVTLGRWMWRSPNSITEQQAPTHTDPEPSINDGLKSRTLSCSMSRRMHTVIGLN